MSFNIQIDTKRLINLIFKIILVSILIYFVYKIIKKLLCKKEYITLPKNLFYSTSQDDIAYYTITSSSLF